MQYSNEHEAYAASRVSQYVYVPSKDTYFTVLDQHADTSEGDIKAPLVILGNEGSGKSALLANWVAKRREYLHRDEFLFQHFVGCSTQSAQLAHTLFRLEKSLKEFFQLREMKVPDTEEELRWSLNRFLAAAAKKTMPARIVIVIDGINRLKAEGVPDGALHWLPTELPPCVRFILSSVEFERVPRSKRDIPQHRTFVELNRRQCFFLRMEPLGAETRHKVVNAFMTLSQGGVELSESQVYKIVTTNATSQPMYLRALMQALLLAAQVIDLTTDQLLDTFLSCQSAFDLIDNNLNLCNSAIFGISGNHENVETGILGKVFAVVYVSRNGLTREEIWGLVKMVNKGVDVDPVIEDKVMLVLSEFTILVNSMHSFSHEVYRELVYDKFIRSHEALIRWHFIMSRYFGQLPPIPRKLVALPYHLEMAGSWSKVKNCLTEIDMFLIWWTPPFKSDFIKFWLSLTRQATSVGDSAPKRVGDSIKVKGDAEKMLQKLKKLDSNGSDSFASSEDNGGSPGGAVSNPFGHQSAYGKKTPSYDIVEEYVKSLDEYILSRKPSDEKVANIILQISDFLLEFATLGNEKVADVPSLLHPPIPAEDLASLGVPHVRLDEDGRNSLVFPSILADNISAAQDDGTDTATKALEDIPVHTIYFFSRWMWIQYPLLALGNCDSKRFQLGIEQQQQKEGVGDSPAKSVKKEVEPDAAMRTSHSAGALKRTKSIPAAFNLLSNSASIDSAKFKLPDLKFNRKAARTFRRITAAEELAGDDADDVARSKYNMRLAALQDSVQSFREEYDFLSQMKGTLSRKLYELTGQLEDLKRSEEVIVCGDSALRDVAAREAEGADKLASVLQLNRNLESMVKIMSRHPPGLPAYCEEIERVIEQDEYLISTIKKRLVIQRHEHETATIKFREMKALVQEGLDMHSKLLEYRFVMKKSLTVEAAEDQRKLQLTNDQATLLNKSKKATGRVSSLGKQSLIMDKSYSDDKSVTSPSQSWQEIWGQISDRTGIIEPEAFFQRQSQGSVLVDQIQALKKASENRLEQLKKDVVVLEADLEEMRLATSYVGGVQSTKDQKKKVAEKQNQLRHRKERSDAAEETVQNVVSGLNHIAELLGLPTREIDEPVNEILRDVEAVLDTLLEEREKQIQQQQQQQHHKDGPQSEGSRSLRDPSVLNPETHGSHRSPELEAVLAKFEEPKARLPQTLPSRPHLDPVDRVEAAEDDDDEGPWDRGYMKQLASRKLKKATRVKNNGEVAAAQSAS